MKKNLFRVLLVLVSFALFSFATPDVAGKNKATVLVPMFGSGTECLSPIQYPNGTCSQSCRFITYIFWIPFYGGWEDTPCTPVN